MPNTKNMPPLGCVVRVRWVGMKGDAPNTKDTPQGRVVCVRRMGWDERGRAEHKKHPQEGVLLVFGGWGRVGDVPNTKDTPPRRVVCVRRMGKKWGRTGHKKHALGACSSSSVGRAVPSHAEHQIQAPHGPVLDVRRVRDRRGVRDKRGGA